MEIENPLGIKRFGPITFCVKNAMSEARRLSIALGMKISFVPEGSNQMYGLSAGNVDFILDGSESARQRAEEYGNHISEIGLWVEDSRKAVALAAQTTKSETGIDEKTAIGYIKLPFDGGISLRILQEGQNAFRGMSRDESSSFVKAAAFQRIDHVVINTGKIAPLVEFMREVLGMRQISDFAIHVKTEEFEASLYSEVMGLMGREQTILFPLNEPVDGDAASQIPAQLREMGSGHVQHIALATDDIVSSIRALRAQGLRFLEFENEQHAGVYYNKVAERLGKIPITEALETLRSLGILVDKCGEGYLLQLFSKRIFPEKSVPFIEIIQRMSASMNCFGEGNFAALAESLERSMRRVA